MKTWAASIRDRLLALRSRKLVAAVGVLLGGTGLGAAISALILPALTRIYNPADFSLLASLNGLISIMSVSACLRLDIAIPLAQDDDEAADVMMVAVLSAAVVTLMVSIGLWFYGRDILLATGQVGLLPYIWLLPVGMLAFSVNAVLVSWMLRAKRFSFIAMSRVVQAAIAAAVQTGAGLLGAGTLGLLGGPPLGMSLASADLARRTPGRLYAFARRLRLARIKHVFSAFGRFPKFSAIEALANTSSIQVPVLMIAALAPAAEAGYLLLAMMVIQAPMGLLGTAIAQVFLAHAPEEERAGRLAPFTTGVIAGLLKTGVGPLLFAGLVAPAVFAILFGQDWQRAGVLLAWMTPWFIMQYLTSPVSMALHIKNRQSSALLLQVFGLLLRVALVYGAFRLAPDRLSESYAVSGFLFYAVYFLVVLRVLGIQMQWILKELRSVAPFMFAWVGAGLCSLLVLRLSF